MSAARDRLPFFSDCVGWPRELLPALEWLIDEGVETSRDAFVRRTGATPDPKILVPDYGGRGPRWVRPWGYSYWRLPGQRVVWYVNSAIEYVYATEETIRRVQEIATATP